MEEINLDINYNNSHLSESQVEFKIFILVDIDLENINQIYEKLTEQTNALSSNYIWNNERFHLNKPQKCDGSDESSTKFAIYSCTGQLDFGDNIEDEWFTVFILNHLTFTYPLKIAAQINDHDGEFLLIHAAHYLPNWAANAADNCTKNRVFLFNGQLHLIPPASKPSEITYLPAAGPISNELNAVKCVFDFPKLTLANQSIQECLNKKLAIFNPDLINKACFHRTTCVIPAKLAWLLKHNPSLISVAINRFCDKHPDDLKLSRFLNHFKPIDLVDYRIQFTKHLYGKLKYCDFKPDKRHEWPPISTLMARQSSKECSETVLRERSIMGFKLTCAFEIFVSNVLNSKNSKSFDEYIDRLKQLGYFKNFLENSKKYNELMEKARQSFEHEKVLSANNEQMVNTKLNQSTNKADKNYANLLESICLDVIDSTDTECFMKLKNEIDQNQAKEADDSEDWLCVEAPQLDDYLEMYSKGDVSSTYDFSIITNAFKQFLQVPKAKKDLLDGVDFKSIDKMAESEDLVDFNVDSIEKNLKDLLSLKKTDKKSEFVDVDELDSEDEEENDSFYEIDDEVLDVDKENEYIEKNLKSYMNSMDDELQVQKNLNRLESKGNNEELELDLNLVSNALESYSSQLGLTGPVSNILKSLGL